ARPAKRPRLRGAASAFPRANIERTTQSLGEFLLARIRQKQNQHGAGDEERRSEREGGADSDLNRKRADNERSEGAQRPAAVVGQTLARSAHGSWKQLGQEGTEQTEIAVAYETQHRSQH